MKVTSDTWLHHVLIIITMLTFLYPQVPEVKLFFFWIISRAHNAISTFGPPYGQIPHL
jgi:hypothetical protein